MQQPEERTVRIQKSKLLAERQGEVYPSTTTRTHEVASFLKIFQDLQSEETVCTLAGRIQGIRRHGGSTFCVLQDWSGDIQLFIKKDNVGEKTYELVNDVLDLGDFFEAKGSAFLTKTGERSLLVRELRVLAKALLPLPEQWHGLQDVETRYRHRELDLIANPEVRKRFIIRSKLISAIRRFLDERNFLEVEVPVLHSIPGGATARPFITHHNALNVDFTLRIASELYLKRLVVGGFEKIYEIGRIFRNEGIDHAHAPEFTMLELYEAYSGPKDSFLDFLEKFLRYVVADALGTTTLSYEGESFDLNVKWKRISFRDAVIAKTGINIDNYRTEESLRTAVEKKKLHVDFTHCIGIGEHYDQLYKKTARPELRQPVWITEYPLELKPLTKASPDDPTKTASAQLIIAGVEVINAYYYELNDPLEQRSRFEEQLALRERGSLDAHCLDEDFLYALEHGMPPTSGMGMGIDRLVMLLTNATNIKEVILFPTLRPENDSSIS